MPEITDFLKLMIRNEASDLFFSPGSPLHMKVDGELSVVKEGPLSGKGVAALAHSIMSDKQRLAFAERPEMNLGLSMERFGRFRVNIFRQRGEVAMVVRYLQDRIPSIAELHLPPVLEDLVMKPRGLILAVGATGAGKSTTLASMLDYRNRNSRSHILTIEDPIEYVHRYHKSVVNQREVGIDTDSYDDALMNAMREAPDVILIGEIRERSTMQHAIAYAETGHLCLSTLHGSNASHVLQRIMTFFPKDMHAQLFMDLAHNLVAIISQRLVRNHEGKRMPAVEVLLITPLIRDLIAKGKLDEVREAMEKSSEAGMQTFDQSLFELFKSGHITEKKAMENAESQSNLGVRIRLDKGEGEARLDAQIGD
ncbi:PilT/PilU family type 4a pilus ATPase [Thiolapillus brandeum]|uniref:Twitching motility protein PilU n=1 Tax=Thiolapillus brandeum TaxID=1076588 RepID=A0A7U6GL15_9GAMM|nr:PilT/PilU family type 4a pilus ATPase [Thiolapillus brandeum]BAO45600.1 twitching motility protein PilU [Thiolapillus brandeum]